MFATSCNLPFDTQHPVQSSIRTSNIFRNWEEEEEIMMDMYMRTLGYFVCFFPPLLLPVSRNRD